MVGLQTLPRFGLKLRLAWPYLSIPLPVLRRLAYYVPSFLLSQDIWITHCCNMTVTRWCPPFWTFPFFATVLPFQGGRESTTTYFDPEIHFSWEGSWNFDTETKLLFLKDNRSRQFGCLMVVVLGLLPQSKVEKHISLWRRKPPHNH